MATLFKNIPLVTRLSFHFLLEIWVASMLISITRAILECLPGKKLSRCHRYIEEARSQGFCLLPTFTMWSLWVYDVCLAALTSYFSLSDIALELLDLKLSLPRPMIMPLWTLLHFLFQVRESLLSKTPGLCSVYPLQVIRNPHIVMALKAMNRLVWLLAMQTDEFELTL